MRCVERKERDGFGLISVVVIQVKSAFRLQIMGGGYRPNSLHRGTGTGMKVVMQTIQILNAKNKQALDVEVHNVVLPSGETGCQVSFLLPVKYDYRL